MKSKREVQSAAVLHLGCDRCSGDGLPIYIEPLILRAAKCEREKGRENEKKKDKERERETEREREREREK